MQKYIKAMNKGHNIINIINKNGKAIPVTGHGGP
jgi:hypothetical protein